VESKFWSAAVLHQRDKFVVLLVDDIPCQASMVTWSLWGRRTAAPRWWPGREMGLGPILVAFVLAQALRIVSRAYSPWWCSTLACLLYLFRYTKKRHDTILRSAFMILWWWSLSSYHSLMWPNILTTPASSLIVRLTWLQMLFFSVYYYLHGLPHCLRTVPLKMRPQGRGGYCSSR
jgi:hypothetical protein